MKTTEEMNLEKGDILFKYLYKTLTKALSRDLSVPIHKNETAINALTQTLNKELELAQQDIQSLKGSLDQKIQQRLTTQEFNTEKKRLTADISDRLKTSAFSTTLSQAMKRTIYVNQETGKDAPGYGESEQKPAKSIGYIANSMPSGSQLKVVLCSDIVMESDANINNLCLILESKKGQRFQIKPRFFTRRDNSLEPTTFYVSGHSSIYCHNLTFAVPMPTSTLKKQNGNLYALFKGGWTGQPQTQLALVLNNVSIEVDSPETNTMALVGQVTGMTHLYIEGNFSAPAAWVNRDQVFANFNRNKMLEAVIFTNDLAKIQKAP